MHEARKSAVTLRRSRSPRSASPPPSPPTWRDAVASRVAAFASPPRQVWLAALGGTALTLRTGHAVWQRLVTEGEAVERWLGTSRRLTASLGVGVARRKSGQ